MKQGKKEDSNQIDRRRLLKGAGLTLGAASTASAAAAKSGSDAPNAAKPQHAGYRETEDVKTYYRTARF